MNRFGFKAQFGSANYNLVLPTSDADYITYLYPSFDDMYDRADWSKPSRVTEDEDNVYNDIRKLRDGLIKGNPNVIEVLFSTNIIGNDHIFEELHHIREDIARANLPALFDACAGMFNQEMKIYEREIKAGNAVKAGKHAASAFRMANILVRYQKSNFNNYGAAIWYKEGNDRRFILAVKRGNVDPRVIAAHRAKYEHALFNLKPAYKEKQMNKEVIQEIKTIVYYYVRKSVARDLGFEGYTE
ncbi:nucleotidyltransferase [Bacillus phage Mater]|uniref:Nucleotidyltransferase n=1 Tax=Bacillus phage Mater TaxID=1540090 RepID=A0A0A0RUV6_9CAUD|nr:nucleotidyltransferase [Bacillus phage Mater]AIW03368.1 nucleotidyltransferase [Bacillus phage Mater]